LIDSEAGEDGILIYRVRWDGYDPRDDSWVSQTDLQGCDALINEYHRKYPDKPK
jgi:hypothetical protein